MHLDPALLLSWLDGELPARRAACVSRHLAACARCRVESGRLQAELDRVVQNNTPEAPDLEADLGRLLARIRGWTGERGRLRQLAAEVTTYFGARAAALLDRVEPCRPEQRGPVSAVEPLFAAFLGRTATENVLRRALRDVT